LRPYRAPAWLPGGHAQTLWPLLIKPRPLPLRRERWDTPDGDFIDVDLSMRRHGTVAGPVPGLEAVRAALRDLHRARLSRRRLALRSRISVALRRTHRHRVPTIRRFPISTGSCAGSRGNTAAGAPPLEYRWAALPCSSGLGTCAAAVAVVTASPLSFRRLILPLRPSLAQGFKRIYTAHFLATLERVSAERLRRFSRSVDEAGCVMRARSGYRRRGDRAGAGFAVPTHCATLFGLGQTETSALPRWSSIRASTLSCPPLPDEQREAVTASARTAGRRRPVGFVNGGLSRAAGLAAQRLLHFFLFERISRVHERQFPQKSQSTTSGFVANP
jgi:hypothetical protein